MALPPPRLAEPLPDLRAVDDALLAHPAAQRALRMGLLEARRAALIQARGLIAWGRPLLVWYVTRTLQKEARCNDGCHSS